MLVVMKAQATEEQIKAVCDHIEFLGYRPHPMPGAQRTAIGITGNQGESNRGNLEEMPGVAEVIKVSKPYKLASRDVKEEDTVIRFRGNGCDDRRRQPGDCGRAVFDREPRAGVCDCGTGGGCGRAVLPRRSIQAADFAVCVSGLGRRCAEDHGGDSRAVRAADHHRGDGQRDSGSGRRVGRRGADRRAQHAELLAAEDARAGCGSRCC